MKKKRWHVLQCLSPFQRTRDTLEQSISLTLASAKIVNNSILILHFPRKMHQLQPLIDAPNYFCHIYM